VPSMNPAQTANAPTTNETALAQTRDLLGLLRRAPEKRALVWLAGLIVAVIVLNALAQLRLNSWQGTFYDAVAQRDLPLFYWNLGVFVVIASVLLVLGVTQTWLHENLKIKLREAVTFDLIDEWLRPKRAYRLPLMGEIGSHPDQRIQDDARRLVELSVDLGVGLMQSTLLLVSFVGVLWGLSAQVVFAIGETRFDIPGYMVWCAVAYAFIGSYVTWLVGKPLIQANADLRAREADFRFLLVRVDDAAEAVAIHRGEEDERRGLREVAGNTFAIMREIASALARLTWITAGYGWLAIVVPIVVAAPGYFQGSLTFGGLMMVAGAFTQVQQSLRWFVDRFPALAEWRATLHRVVTYRDALVALENLGGTPGLITYSDHPEGKLALDGVRVFAPNGQVFLPESFIEVAPGERLLIVGTPRCGKSTFFRALAGLWVWGKGSIRLPKDGTITFLPHKPYIPVGTLKEALTYPTPPNRFSDREIGAALSRMRLERFTPLLDRSSSWDQEITLDEQQRIALARVLLHKPDWVIQDEAISELDDDSRQLAESLFHEELAHAALVSIGRKSGNGDFYNRVLELQVAPPSLALPLTLPGQSQSLREAPLEAPPSSQDPFVARGERVEPASKTG
jgi:vitamin B12/bleomycin/antimicrobial peptide transport system ATP-binding/permease protein